ncbi:putative beta chain spectrin [Schistosoma mansoni]|uniref:putative beta chain spectrin n=1 Tax=Schistosoma mansoni TaxID=6183 RepID=UPI00022DC380|nr:putative beta chain spectrin [Schistosoma mansoni]|eukprot:XP_018652093.1 putative beta chain spectrin [Schistosoma mansoni]
MDIKKKILVELHDHAKILSNLDNENQNSEVESKMYSLIKKFWKIQIFIYQHAEELKAQKHIYQLYRDLENERIWTHEKLLLANNTYIGRSLFAVNQLIRQHQLLIKEVNNRTNRIEITIQVKLRYDLNELKNQIIKRTDQLNIGLQCFIHLDEFIELRNWLQECEDLLLLESRASRDIITTKIELKKHANIEYRVNILLANCICEFNQKSLKLINEFLERKEKHKNQLELIKTNENLEKVVQQLSGISTQKQTDQSQRLQSIVHADENMNKSKQNSFDNLINRRKLRSQIKQIRKRIQMIQSIQRIMDRQYSSLLDVCVQKRQRLEEILSLSIVYEEVSELKSWLNQQILIASSIYTGRSLNECVRLINRFVHFGENLLGESFTSFVEIELRSFDPISTIYPMNITDQFVYTSGFAIERIEKVMNMCRCLIRTKHSDSPRIAYWQDIITETWADLHELIYSRVRLLISAAHRFIFLTRCSETLKLVQEKSDQLSQSIGKDVQAICKQLSLLCAFEQDVQALEPLINWVEKAADYLLPLYSGNWIKRLKKPHDILLSVWYQLKDNTHLRRIRLNHAIALYRWISNLDILFNWIQQCQKELERIEMDIWNINPQSTIIKKSNNITTENIKFAIGQTLQLRAELNARDDKVKSCLEEGKRLKASFKQHLMQYDKSKYEKCHQPYEMSQLYLKTEMERQHVTNNSADEIEICKISEQRKNSPKNTLQNLNVTEQHTRTGVIRSISSDPYLESVSANYSQKSGSSSSALNQLNLQNDSQMNDEENQIITDLQLRMKRLVTSWYNLHMKWHQINERLELQLSINEFESVADSLEHWLILHSPEVECLDMGDSIKETQILIDRLNVLERNTLPQINRYEKVKQLTKFELAEIKENMLNVPISCVNIVHNQDTENIQTLLKYYELNEKDVSNDLDDCKKDVDTSQENLKDTTDSTEVSRQVEESSQHSFDSISDYLMRKHEWINHNCKSRDRSWYELYMVLNTSVKQLLAYKNKSDYDEDNPLSNTFRGEIGLLVGQNLITANETKDYTKRANTFRITSTATGARYLFQAQTSEIMRKWLNLIQNINRQTRSTLGPTIITLSRPSEEFQNPLVIIDMQETFSTSKKLTLTQILKSKTTNQISCIRRHSSTQENDFTNNLLENIESPQCRMKRFPSVRTMRVFSPRQMVRWLTFKYSSFSPNSSSTSHQTPKLIRSNTSHNMKSEQSNQSTPLLRKSLTYSSLHKISRFSMTSKSLKDT